MTLAETLKEWEQTAPQEWRELRRKQGTFLSAHNPALTHSSDLLARRIASIALTKLAVKFFRERGHEITCEMCADGESFNIYGPPEPLVKIEPSNEPA